MTVTDPPLLTNVNNKMVIFSKASLRNAGGLNSNRQTFKVFNAFIYVFFMKQHNHKLDIISNRHPQLKIPDYLFGWFP